jgi:hypothetical protein
VRHGYCNSPKCRNDAENAVRQAPVLPTYSQTVIVSLLSRGALATRLAQADRRGEGYREPI